MEHKIILNGQKDRESESRLQTLNEKKKKTRRFDLVAKKDATSKQRNASTNGKQSRWRNK